MTSEEVIRMAQEAGFGIGHAQAAATLFERFASLVAAAEREACAKICDTTPPYPFRPSIEAAHAIRARGIE